MCAFLAETGWTARPSDIAPLSICRDAPRVASCPQARWPGDEVPGFHASWARPSRHAARRQRVSASRFCVIPGKGTHKKLF